MTTTIMEATLVGTVPDEVAREINDEHRAFEGAMRDSLMHARRCGELLLDVKEKLPHGAFMAWVEGHCEFAHRTATLYMRIAREWALIEANWQGVANFGITMVDAWLGEQGVDSTEDEAHKARWDAEIAEWDAEVARMRADPDAHLTKYLWQQIGEGLGTVHDALTRLQDHVGEGNPTVDQMIAVVERLDEERYRQVAAFDEVAATIVT